MEEKTKVKVYKVKKRCDACGEGYMMPTGITLTSYPPQYPHKCTKCENAETFTTRYPKIVYEEE